MVAAEWLGPLPDSNWDDTPRTVEGIVDHTMVGTIESATGRFENPSSIVSAALGVGLSGRIVLWVALDRIAYHAGNWPINVKRIGIEHEDDGRYWDAERTPEMYLASGALHAALAAEFHFPLDDAHVGPHSRFRATACPDALDIPRILAIANGEDIMISRSEYDAAMRDISNSFEAVKALLNPLAVWAAGAPTISKPNLALIKRHLAVISVFPGWKAKRRPAPKRRPRTAPTRLRVMMGHGKGRR